MDDRDIEDGEGEGRRRLFWRALVAVAGVGALALAASFFLFHDDREPPRLVHELTIVKILPPPPPPPPPPPVQKPKMVEQTPDKKEDIREQKPIEQPKPTPQKQAKTDAPPPGPLSLDKKAEGPGDLFNLGGKPGGRGLFGGGGEGGGSRWGWYATIVETQIEAALRANAKTRGAVMQLQARLWADPTGRVTRVQLVSSSGNSEIDAAIRDEVLAGLTLREPPPKDMPMPIVTRISERRPG